MFGIKMKYSIVTGQLGRVKGLHEELKENLKVNVLIMIS